MLTGIGTGVFTGCLATCLIQFFFQANLISKKLLCVLRNYFQDHYVSGLELKLGRYKIVSRRKRYLIHISEDLVWNAITAHGQRLVKFADRVLPNFLLPFVFSISL